MPYERLDGKPVGGAIVGLGRAGLVILHKKHTVLKIPAICRSPNASPDQVQIEDILAEQNCAFIENEKLVYQRLGHHDGIVGWTTLSDEGIEMDYMKNGPLSRYLESEVPSHRQAGRWITAIAKTVNYAHTRHVILGDIASRNVLLEDDMSAKLCDFSDSGLMPFDCDMSSAEDNGASIQTDIFEFGSLIYEILTRRCYKYDLFANEETRRQRELNEREDWAPGPAWPREESLPPDTEHLPLGDVIRMCWTKSYQSMQEVCDAVDRAIYMLQDSDMATEAK